MSAAGELNLRTAIRSTGRWTWHAVIGALIEWTVGAAIGALAVLAIIEWVKM